jgi:hypothetical protein
MHLLAIDRLEIIGGPYSIRPLSDPPDGSKFILIRLADGRYVACQRWDDPPAGEVLGEIEAMPEIFYRLAVLPRSEPSPTVH